MQAQDLLKKALALPERERAELAGNLLDSLDKNVDDDADVAWQKEIARRLKEANSGTVKTVSWNEVRNKARQLLYGE
jgi:putative addiction module component (TIGR02574 family)